MNIVAQYTTSFLTKKRITMTNDIEKVIDHLSKKGVSIVEIRESLGLEHGAFYSWRRSIKRSRQEELAKAIIEKFEIDFKDMDKSEPKQESQNQVIQNKYTNLLEKRVEELEKERDSLLEENLRILEEVRQELKGIAGRMKARGE